MFSIDGMSARLRGGGSNVRAGLALGWQFRWQPTLRHRLPPCLDGRPVSVATSDGEIPSSTTLPKQKLRNHRVIDLELARHVGAAEVPPGLRSPELRQRSRGVVAQMIPLTSSRHDETLVDDCQPVKRQPCAPARVGLPFVSMGSRKAPQRLEDIEPGSAIGGRIKIAMIAEGRSMKPTEVELGMSEGHLGRIIKGQRWRGQVDVELARRMAQLFHVNFLWLIADEGPMRREGRGSTKAETAMAFARQFGAREDAISSAWERNKDRESEMEVLDWMNAINVEAARLAHLPRPEVVHDEKRKVRREKEKLKKLEEPKTTIQPALPERLRVVGDGD